MLRFVHKRVVDPTPSTSTSRATIVEDLLKIQPVEEQSRLAEMRLERRLKRHVC